MINKLQNNIPVCWILWEAKNLYQAFNVGETNGPEFNTICGKDHEMVDTIENIEGCCMQLIGYKSDDNDAYEMFNLLKISLISAVNKEFEIK